jgi:sec-independent protein translocase protein TatA
MGSGMGSGQSAGFPLRRRGEEAMEALSPFHLLIILAVIVLLFGGRKIPEVMKGLGEGIRSFKEGMRGDTAAPPAQPGAPTSTPASTPTEEKK